MSMRRRAVLLLPAAACAGVSRAATLPAPRSLRDELAAALGRGRPLLVMASLDGCPFCRQVRDAHLAPLRAEAGQPVVQLDMGSAAVVADFDGRATTHEQLLRAWRVGVAPTVLFFGRGGREIAERLVGASIPDFYGAYLEQRVQAALKGLS
jgi:thioredoxin-related protein